MDNTIFVQIASYRDPELLPTIRDCIKQAKYPELLSFGICWQHAEQDTWDDLSEYIHDERFRIFDVDWTKSKGLGWARQITQTLYKDEKFTLQLDSHHRFIYNWDTELLEMMKQTGSNKPILTTYGMPYTPGKPLIKAEPYIMVGTKFSSYGTILFYPHVLQDAALLTKPIPARFVSGHFFFTIGQHCIEYKYDPDIYFAGDEISLSIRSFTLGYDIFHPHKSIVWHEYTREGRKKHWDDFTVRDSDMPLWHDLDNSSKRKLRHLLQEENNNIDLGEFGLGNIRTHKDYETYAGINFKLRLLHPNTVCGNNPPVNDYTYNWDLANIQYSFTLTIPKIDMTEIQFICICIENTDNLSLYRTDITSYINQITTSFKTHSEPHHWVFWPYFKTTGWGDKQTFILDANSVKKI
jgi:hypothetical protein